MAILGKRKLIRALDVAKIKGAIAEAERVTSGEIRVSISPYFWGRVRPVAERAFHRLKMDGTKDRNWILFFVVPTRRRFVVLGDAGIHARVGQEFWDDVAGVLAAEFRKGRFQEGLLQGIDLAGRKLAAYFPYDPATDRNELPDDVDYGES
jgi:uncharacterized membrane protein